MFAERIQIREKIKGTMLRSSRNPIIVNLAKNAGLDFVMADMEHGSYTLETLSDIFTTARLADLGVFVRVPELSRGYISRALDLGANGVMVPMIETVEQAKLFVEWSKYTPIGKRGLTSCGGHTEYIKEKDIPAMMDRINKQTLSIAQIETVKGVENAEAISAVDGIDVLLIGPNDLAVSLGCPGELDSKSEQEAILKVALAAKKNGKIFGMHAGFSLLEKWIPYNMGFVMSSIDMDILYEGMKDIACKCKSMMESEKR